MKIKVKREINQDERLTDEQIIDLLLQNRNITNKEDFLYPKHPKDILFTEFFSEKQFEKVVKKLREIKLKNEMIVVYTDYDADGITGGAILWETLHLLGFKTMPYVPHRKLEGYGFSKKGLNNIKELYNPSLIISVDHGISAAEKISYAKSLGMSVVVTDHHMKTAKKPNEALAVFHTDKLSGAGVSYFIAREIFEEFSLVETQNFASLQNYFQTDYLSLSSIGTIADLVPLIGPSRSITKYGLEAFSKLKRIGIKHILKEAGLEHRRITTYEIGFIIAPRINALGRLEHAIDALRLLCTKKATLAQMLAAKIGHKNRERQDLVIKSVGEAVEKVKNQPTLKNIIVLSSEIWHEGIIGLIASRLVDKFYRPTIIITFAGEFAKGSARSIPGFDVTSFLRLQKKYLIDVGGHKGASGFTMEKDRIREFIITIEKQAQQVLTEKDLEKIIEVDLSIPLSKINPSLVKKIEKLQPFGIGNPEPLFYSEGELVEAKLFGKNSEHLKVYLKDESSMSPLEIVLFNQGQQIFKLSVGQKVPAIFNLEINRWNGREQLRGKGKYI